MDGPVTSQGAVDRRARGRAAVTGLALLAGLELVTAVVGTVALGWSWQEAMDAFVVTNATMGATFTVSGALIAWHRSRNPIGWLFLAAGVAFSTSAAMVPVATQLNSTGTTPQHAGRTPAASLHLKLLNRLNRFSPFWSPYPRWMPEPHHSPK